MESLTPKPGIREQHRPSADILYNEPPNRLQVPFRPSRCSLNTAAQPATTLLRVKGSRRANQDATTPVACGTIAIARASL
jgi:hypothetical protein